jgi:hypothetical protein
MIDRLSELKKSAATGPQDVVISVDDDSGTYLQNNFWIISSARIMRKSYTSYDIWYQTFHRIVSSQGKWWVGVYAGFFQ